MTSRKRCIQALFSWQWDSPFNKAEILSHNMLSEDATNHASSNLHFQNKRSGQWRWNSSILRMSDLAKPSVTIPSWKGKMDTKDSFQLWLISFSPSWGRGRLCLQSPCPGAKGRFQSCLTVLRCVVLNHRVTPALWQIDASHCSGKWEERLQKQRAGFLLYLPSGQCGETSWCTMCHLCGIKPVFWGSWDCLRGGGRWEGMMYGGGHEKALYCCAGWQWPSHRTLALTQWVSRWITTWSGWVAIGVLLWICSHCFVEAETDTETSGCWTLCPGWQEAKSACYYLAMNYVLASY